MIQNVLFTGKKKQKQTKENELNLMYILSISIHSNYMTNIYDLLALIKVERCVNLTPSCTTFTLLFSSENYREKYGE